jgi:hypothetical protein
MDNVTPQQQREALLLALYDQAGGSTSQPFETTVAAKAIGLDEDRADEHVVVLKQSGLVDHLSMGGTGILTARGITEAERLKRQAEQAAAAAPVILTVVERGHLEAFLGALDRSGIEEQLSGSDLAEYQADVDTARAQLKSPKPKRSAVRAAVRQLVDFVKQTGANVAASVITNVVGL